MGISAEPEGWGPRLTRSIAGEVKRRRKELGWSAQRLSAECTALGFDFPRSTLADLESGRRAQLSVAELVVLAAALGVPPLLLLYPVGYRAEAEVLPGEVRPAFRSALWFTAEASSPARAADEGEVIVAPDRAGTARPLALYREHDQEFRAELDVIRQAEDMDEQAALALTDDLRKGSAAMATALRQAAEIHRRAGERIREEASAEGLIPPARILGLIVPDASKEPAEEKDS